MIELNGKRLCENCFAEIKREPCPECGYDPNTTAPDPLTLKPGSILRGKYIVGKCLGKGGFGITYLAYDINSGKKIAIKEYYPMGLAVRTVGNPTVQVANAKSAAVFKDGAEKFYEEAKLVSRFNGNPNIVSVYEFFYENDTAYFSMEYLKGVTLNEYVTQKGKLFSTQVLFIADNITNALMATHSASVLHRDVSPDNIMLCEDGGVKLLDFGAARQVIAEHSQNFSVILKPGFAPLEQYQKKGNQGAWTDIYSLGASLFFALTGNIPEDPMSRLDEETTFDENRYGIFPGLWKIIVKATMMKISDRYADIFEMRRDLNSVNAVRQPVFMPEEIIREEEESLPGAEPVEQTPTAATPSATAVILPTVQDPVQTAPTQKKPGFFAAHKKLVIAGISGAAAVAAAAVILVVALQPGRKDPGQDAGGWSADTNNSAISINSIFGSNSEESSSAAEDPGRTTVTVGSWRTYPIDTEIIELKDANLSDDDLSELKYLKNLKTLVLDDNYIQSLSFVEDIPSLECLYLHNNYISDLSPLKSLPNLVEFGANNNPITDISVLSNKTKLKKLWLCDTNISDISALQRCTRLEELGLNNCSINGKISVLAGMSELKMLYMYNCGIYSIEDLYGKPMLNDIGLGGNSISDVSPLADCKEIEYLDVSSNSLNESSISTFAGLNITGDVYVQGNGYTEAQAIEIDKLLPPEAQVWWLW